jgi:hypothetical protein
VIKLKNRVQARPLAITARATPITWARLPAIKFPKGIIPAKVNIKTLITLPLNLSGALVCRIVLIKAVALTLAPPKNIRINAANR